MNEYNLIQAQEKIKKLLSENDVVLFMKGTSDMPMCGFSGTVVSILKMLKVPFLDINVLEDPEMMYGVKSYTQWPTTPQLFIKGEFIGGCDITKELLENGELVQMLKDKGIIS